MMDALTHLDDAATDIDAQTDDGRTIVDFDVALDVDHDLGHEVKSQLTVEDDTVTEGVVRFGSAPLYDDEFIDTDIWSDVWTVLCSRSSSIDCAFEARLSHFGRPIPHLCFSGMPVDEAARMISNLAESLSDLYSLPAAELGERVDEVI